MLIWYSFLLQCVTFVLNTAESDRQWRCKMENVTAKNGFSVLDSSFQPTSEPSPSSGKTIKAVATPEHGQHITCKHWSRDWGLQESWGFGTHTCVKAAEKSKGRHSIVTQIPAPKKSPWWWPKTLIANNLAALILANTTRTDFVCISARKLSGQDELFFVFFTKGLKFSLGNVRAALFFYLGLNIS